jgi:hypothetical protein
LLKNSINAAVSTEVPERLLFELGAQGRSTRPTPSPSCWASAPGSTACGTRGTTPCSPAAAAVLGRDPHDRPPLCRWCCFPTEEMRDTGERITRSNVDHRGTTDPVPARHRPRPVTLRCPTAACWSSPSTPHPPTRSPRQARQRWPVRPRSWPRHSPRPHDPEHVEPD